MCGIAGLFHLEVPKPVDPLRVRAMADSLAHRGPDGSGVWTGPGIGLGHRRLSIIDLEGGAQPMVSADGRLALSYNGEIYNFREVRAELEAKGHLFRTSSDTEVVLAAWRQWGAGCLSRFNGMFAFALWDADLDCLFLARDRLGVKPLYVAALSDGALAFASELKGLLAHPLLRRAVDPRAVDDYLALGYVPDDGCIVEGVAKLAAGHYLLAERDVGDHAGGDGGAQPLDQLLLERGGGSAGGVGEVHIPPADRRRQRAAALGEQIMAGGKLGDAVDDAAVVGDIAERQIIVDRPGIDGPAEQGMGEQPLELGGEGERSVGQGRDEKRLHPEPVAGEEQAVEVGVPESEGEHAVEPLHAARPEVLV